MSGRDDYHLFVVDIVSLIWARIAATQATTGQSSGYQIGRDLALREVLDLMRNKAESFGIDLRSVGLDVDPLTTNQ